MDLRKIKKLVEILEESDLAELEIHEENQSVRLSRYSASPPVAYPTPAAATAGPAPSADAGGRAGEASDAGAAEPEMEGHVIRAPMVGTFYNAPNPDSEPFVRPGQTIKAGDSVCIIEAMKMFNQIESDIDGKVATVLVDNGQPVEFDQPLFIIR